MKLSDYVVDILSKAGVKTIFGVTGGSVVHLFHSAEKHSSLKVVYTHHEQAASFAADAVGHFQNQIGACFVTTGPGGTNAITGLASAWLDSVPVIFISGQARSEHLTSPDTVRQIGSQHIDIVSVVKPLTKFARTIKSISETRRILEEAIFICNSGRPGPVWIDIPLDFQWSEIDIDAQKSFIKPTLKVGSTLEKNNLMKLISSIKKAKRPLIVVGTGIKISGMAERFVTLVNAIQVPCVLTWNTLDMLDSKSHLNLGLLGIAGSRDANLIAQSADLIITFGSHLSNQLIGNSADEFAPKAEIYVIDIDLMELDRLPLRFNKIQSDLRTFLPALESELKKIKFLFDLDTWKKSCVEIKNLRDYGINLEKKIDNKFVGQYYFYRELSKIFKKTDIVVIDGGGNTLFSAFNSLRLVDSQNIISGAGIGCMGSGLPHAIGAAYTKKKSVVYCIIGDGSMQFNIQELATIEYNKLPIKIIIINNDGYKSIKDTQDNFFDQRFGVNSMTGLSFPLYKKIASTYKIPYFGIHIDKDVNHILDKILLHSGPSICEVFVDPETQLIPRAGFVKMENGLMSKLPTYDMYPLLPRNIFKRLMS